MKNQIRNITFILNIIGIFISIYSIQFVGILLIFFCIVVNKELILTNLVLTPFYETTVVIYEGISASKILYLFVICLTLVHLITKQYKKIILIDCLIVFALLFAFSTFNNIHAFKIGIIKEFSFFSYISYYSSRIILLFLLVNFLVNQSDKFLQNSTNYLSLSLAFVIPIVFIYLQTNFVEINWYNEASRQVLVGTDPNELSVILISYFPFLLINKKFNFVIKIFLIILSILIILKLASRTSIILIFALILFLPFYLYNKKSSRLFYFIILVVGFTFSLDFILESNASLVNRLTFSNDVNIFTGNRFDLYVGSINAFFDNPIFGYGANNTIASEINFKYSGTRLVSHNTILEFIMSFGIVGVFSVFFLIFNNKKYFKFQNSYLANIYLLSLLTLILGSFSLSWLWREILWVLFAIYFSLNYRKYKQTLK